MTRSILPLLLVACGSTVPGDFQATKSDTGPSTVDTDTTTETGDDDDDDTVGPTGDTGPELPACVDAVFPGPGTTSGMGDDLDGSCSGSGNDDVSVLFTASTTGRWKFDLTDIAFDGSLYAYRNCGEIELGCANEAGSGEDEVLVLDLNAGDDVILVVDGHTGAGAYTLDATLLEEGEQGLCDDGVDNDFDDLVDCADPDCEGEAVCVEVCDDGIDNDADGLPDCADDACSDEPHCDLSCVDVVLSGALPLSWYDSTVGASNDHDPGDECTILHTTAGDRIFGYVPTTTGELTIDTLGSDFDTVVNLYDGCGGTLLECNDEALEGSKDHYSSITREFTAGVPVIIVVDGYLDWEGDVRLNIYE